MQQDVGRLCANTMPFYIRDLSVWILVSMSGPGTNLPLMLKDSCVNSYVIEKPFKLWFLPAVVG